MSDAHLPKQSPGSITGTKASIEPTSTNISVHVTNSSTGLSRILENTNKMYESPSDISLATITTDHPQTKVEHSSPSQSSQTTARQTDSPNSTTSHLGTRVFSSPTLQELHHDVVSDNSPASTTSSHIRPQLTHTHSSHSKLSEIAHKFGDLIGGHSHGHSIGHRTPSNPTSSTNSPIQSPAISRDNSTASLSKLAMENSQQHNPNSHPLHSHQLHSSSHLHATSPSHPSTLSSLRSHLPSIKHHNGIRRNSSRESFSLSKSKKSTTCITNLKSSDSSSSYTSISHSSNSSNSVNTSGGAGNGISNSSSTTQLEPQQMKQTPSKVKETHYVHVEYDPVSRRRVLNTYEILKDLGSGQHGKVKLAKDITSNEYVAIKIVDRKSKPKLGRLTKPGSTQEDKIRKEIAIMKKCDHENVVKLIEVLDADGSRKIYLVLEFMEKGEIKWQHRDEDTDYEPEPLLNLVETKQVFRDVVSGLEYLHHQGIIHRDIKPSNLLVSKDLIVKISDFGVSFADSLDGNDELELAKTAGTPAFLAPELCKTNCDDTKVTYKIDIWALGVTLFCLLFGRLPFNGDSEFLLFDSINTKEAEYPDMSTWKTAAPVPSTDFEEAKDLLSRLLDKNPDTRADISEIKLHPFFQNGLSRVQSKKYTSNWRNEMKIDVTNKEVDEAVIGIASRIRKKINNVLQATGLSTPHSTSTSSSNLTPSSYSSPTPRTNSQTLQIPTFGNEDPFSQLNGNHSFILSESLQSQSSLSKDSEGASNHNSIRHKSISHSVDSSVSTSSATPSFVNAEASLHSSSGPKSSVLTQLSEIIEKDLDNRKESDDDKLSVDSLDNNDDDFFVGKMTSDDDPSVSTITEKGLNKTNEKEVKQAHFLPLGQELELYDVNASEVQEIPKPTYDFREELKKSEDNKASLPIAHSFASLDSFYDEHMMSNMHNNNSNNSVNNNPMANRFVPHGNESPAYPRYQYQPPTPRQVSNRLSSNSNSTLPPGIRSRYPSSGNTTGSTSASSRSSPINSTPQSGVSISDYNSNYYNVNDARRPQPLSGSMSSSYYNRTPQSNSNNYYNPQLQRKPFARGLHGSDGDDDDDNDNSSGSDSDSGPITFSKRRYSNSNKSQNKVRPASIYGTKIQNVINQATRQSLESGVPRTPTHALLNNDEDDDDEDDDDEEAELTLSFGSKNRRPPMASYSNAPSTSLSKSQNDSNSSVDASTAAAGVVVYQGPDDLQDSTSGSELLDVPLGLMISHVDPEDTEVDKLLPEMINLKMNDSSAVSSQMK